MKTSTIRAVLFDAGNTLVHLDYDFIAEVLSQHGYRFTPLAIRIAEYGSKAIIDRELAPEVYEPGSVEGLLWPNAESERPSYFAVALHQLGIPRDEAKPILEALRAHNEARCLWRVMEPDTPGILSTLRARGYTLAVVSNSDGRIENDLESKGLRHHFATVIDSHVVGVEKPNSAIFNLALERLGTPADAAIYVGDVFAIDVMGARSAGMEAVLIDPLDRYPGRVACLRIRRLAELLDLLPDRAFASPRKAAPNRTRSASR